MIYLKKGEINISFSNHTFNLNLNEGESIDKRLKNENGNIYLGQIENNQKDTIQNKMNGYSSVGISETVQKENTNSQLQSQDKVTSSISNILNEKSEKSLEEHNVQDSETKEIITKQSLSNNENEMTEHLEDVNEEQNKEDSQEDTEETSSRNKYVSLYIDNDSDDEEEDTEKNANRGKYAPLYIDEDDE
jgi:hypothetical protein